MGGFDNASTSATTVTIFAGSGDAELNATGKAIVVGGTLSVISDSGGNAGTNSNISVSCT